MYLEQKTVRYNILYVDDEAMNLLAFAKYFGQDYNLFTVINPKKGFKILQENEIHLVISDFMMPVINGIEFLTEVKKNYPDTKLILISAFDDFSMLIKAVNDLEIFRFISKPYEPTKLRSVIKKALLNYQLKEDKNHFEKVMKESLESLSVAQHIAHIGNWELNLQDNTLKWSDEIYRIFGVDPKDFEGIYEAFMHFVHPDDRELIRKTVTESINSKTDYNVTFRIVRPDKTERIMHTQSKIIIDTTGKAVLMVGTTQDITERKKVEAELAQHREHLEDLVRKRTLGLENAKELIKDNEEKLQGRLKILTDLSKSRILSDSDMYNSFYKITESGVRGFDVQRLSIWLLSEDRTVLRCKDLFEREKKFHSNDQELSETDYPDYFAQLILGEIIAAEDAHSDPITSGFSDSYLIPLNISSMLDIPIRVSGEIAGVLCIEHTGTQRRWSIDDVNFGLSLADLVALIIEISHRKHTEKELLKSETRNKALLNAVPDMIFRVKRDGTYLELIPGKGIKTIVPESDFIGKTISDIVPTETAQLIMKTIENVLQTGLIQISEYQFLISDEIHYREARFISLGKDEVMIIERDVSDRKMAEESLKRHSEELENFNNIMVNREMRIIELKEEVNKLAAETGMEEPYPPDWEKDNRNITN